MSYDIINEIIMVFGTHKQSYLLFLAITSILIHIVASKIITTPVTADLSELSGDWKFCPEGKYATAFRLKFIESRNLFGVGLTSIALYCNTPSGMENSFRIISHDGVLGNWGDKLLCEGLLIGFASTRTYGPALRNFKGFCASLDADKAAIEGDGKSGGNWTRGVHCLPKQAICGFRVHFRQFWLLNGDEITNIEMKCCNIPNPAANCKATDSWGTILGFDNIHGNITITWPIDKRIGVTTSNIQPFSKYLDQKILALIGFTTEDAIPYVAAAFTDNLDKESKVHHQWSSESSQTWSTEINELQELPAIEGGTHVILSQVVGQCGGYIVHSGRFRKIEIDSRVVGNIEGGNVTISEFTWVGNKMVPISKDLIKSP